MAELKKLLSALIKGNGSFEQVNAAVQQYLTQSPQHAPLVAKLLKAARDAGLPHPMYVSLSGSVTARIAADRVPDPGVQALEGEGADPERTLPPSPAGGSPGDSDETLVVSAGEGVTPPSAEPDDDKTIALSSSASEDKTQLLPPQDGFSAEDTEMEAGLDNDQTAVNPGARGNGGNGAASTDFTEVNPSTDSTRADETDKTLAIGQEVDFDVFADGAFASGDETAEPDTGASWPTIREEQRPGISRAFREGDHLRERFQLLSKLGEGGMGAVWKGKDLLKEEARDRNPFVAIKLLQGDFKEHPEAFIALQRETAKQQRLAHPNVATVYDFDRDDASNTVFMTMEVLEGQPLDAFIRKLPQGGLPVDEAMPLIEQLCNGLGYAHSHGLVHADLKPGNCFFTKDGTIKLLDFGIARASKTKADAEGETTLFDPGELGALTPAYATVEMFEGTDPDPRDDIYALAIMTYQLLSGIHPYGKKPAPKARQLGLKPEPIPKLNKRQNKALMRGLAFERGDRTATVEAFFESIRPRKSRVPIYAAAGLAAVLVMGLGVYGPVFDLIDKYRREQVISIFEQPGIESLRTGLDAAAALDDPDQLNLVLNDPRTKDAIVAAVADGGEKSINQVLSLMAPFDPNWQRDVKEIEQVKSAIMNVFNSKIHDAFNVKQDRYDYATASAVIAELDRLYPDSAKVLQRKTLLNQERGKKLAELSDDYTRYLEQGFLLPEESARDIGDVIEVVRQIDPEHPLLNDDRLRFRYGELAEAAIDEKAYGRADALLRASLTYAPGDSKLTDLRFRVQSELQRIANERRVAEIEQRLGPRLASINALPDFLEIRDDLIVLGDLSPDSKLLANIQGKLRRLFNDQMRISTSQRNWAEGERVLLEFSNLFDIPYLMKQRQLLSKIEQQAGYALEMTPQREAAVQERVRTISRLLAEPEFTSDWETQLKVPYKELLALLPGNDPTLAKVREQTARLYLQNAESALQSERFVEALAFVDRGRVFYPELDSFNDFHQTIVSAQEDWRKRREEAQRLARIDALKNDFRAATQRNDVQDADAKLAAIRSEGVPADDPFLATEAPLELANAYLRLAQGRIEGERPDFEQALALARKGLEYAPGNEALRNAVAEYEVEVEQRQLEIALRNLFESSEEIDLAAARTSLDKLRADVPDRYTDLQREFAETRANRIRQLVSSNDSRISSLGRRLEEYKALFPEESGRFEQSLVVLVDKQIRSARVSSARDVEALSALLTELRRLSPEGYTNLSNDLSAQLVNRIRSLEKTDRLSAANLLQASIQQFGEAPFRGISIEMPMKEISEGMQLIASGRLTAARKNLAAARSKDPAHADLPAFERALESRMERARAEYQRYAQAASGSRSTRDQPTFDNQYASIRQLWSDNPDFRRIQIAPPRRGACSSELAGYGKRRGGECWDVLGRAKGPLMVVVPAGGAVSAPFAISKYEISGSDYNNYCKATGKCNRLPRSKARLPLTSISAQEAEAFAQWLSEQASKAEQRKVVYRLPTEAEWEHAARAAGVQPAKKYNCRVTAGGSVISGHALVDAASGAQNGWGLANYIGNAQEWVRSSSGLKARGGSFQDPLTRCDLSISRGHSGQPDGVTGFRLVREMG